MTISFFGGLSRLVQVVNFETGNLLTGTTAIPDDDTIPQSGEGDEYFTLSITPRDSNNILIIDAVIHCCHSNFTILCAALFQDAIANALAAGRAMQVSTQPTPIIIRHKMLAGTTVATTFRVRAGANGAGTLSVNGELGVRRLGGALMSSITIMEVVP